MSVHRKHLENNHHLYCDTDGNSGSDAAFIGTFVVPRIDVERAHALARAQYRFLTEGPFVYEAGDKDAVLLKAEGRRVTYVDCESIMSEEVR